MKVFVVGLGTIGKPLVQLFLNVGREIGVEELIFHKNTPELKFRGTMVDFCRAGAKLAVWQENINEFKTLLAPYRVAPDYTFEEALEKADVIINCTPKGVGLRLKETYYRHGKGRKLFIAQGSETGFGKPYAFGINDAALQPEDAYIHVVSCNTHQLLCLLKTLAFDPYQYGAWNKNNLVRARFYLGRRASDVSQTESTVGVEVSTPDHDHPYGSHQGKDAADVLDTMGEGHCFDIHAAADILPNSFMHVVHFDITLREQVTRHEVEMRFRRNKLAAVTYWQTNNEVFGEGRDRGHFGRILNQTVVCLPSLEVRSEGHEIIGRCFTPQDGNPLLSSVAAALWFFDPQGYQETTKQHLFKAPFLFEEV